MAVTRPHPSHAQTPWLTAAVAFLAGLGAAAWWLRHPGGAAPVPLPGLASAVESSAVKPVRAARAVNSLIRLMEPVDTIVFYNGLLAAHPHPESAIIVEVGSFDGTECRRATDMGFGKVVCFEPGPTNFENAKAKMDGKIDENHLVLQKVVGNTTGEKVVFHAAGTMQDHAGPINPSETNLNQQFKGSVKDVEVETQALDDYFTDKEEVFFAKIDTQGFDGVVLTGMRRLLASHRVHFLSIELWPTAMARAVPCEDALNLLIDSGYTLYETAVAAAFDDVKPSREELFNRPTTVPELCNWYLAHSKQYGLWADILATADPLLGGVTPA